MSAAFLRKYGVATTVYVPVLKRDAVDFAVAADWVPAAGDCRISIDGAASNNLATLPTAIVMGNTAMWAFPLSTGELTGKKISVTVADSATKAVEDQMFVVETYGHALAEYQADLSAATLPANLLQIDGVANGTHSAGMAPVDLRHIVGVAVNTALAQLGVNTVSGTVGSVTGAVGSVTGNVGGNVVGSVGSVTGAVGSVTGAVGSVTGNVGGNVQGSVASVATNGITAASLAADAVAELADGVWDEARAGHTTAGTFGEGVASVQGSVTGSVGSVSGNLTGNVTGSVGSLGTQAKLDVNAEVVDALATDVYTEPGQEAPGVSVSLAAKIGYLYKAFRNRLTQTSTTLIIYQDDGVTAGQRATVSDDGTTYTRGEIVSGP